MSQSRGKIPGNSHIQKWVKEIGALCEPDRVFWCDGSEDERQDLTRVAVETERHELA